MKRITVDNYRQFKPSQFVRSFLSDLDVAVTLTKKTGEEMNMDSWYQGNSCLPCLSGMACLNMGIPPLEGIGVYVFVQQDIWHTNQSRTKGFEK